MRRATIAGLAVALVSILPAHSQTAEAAAPIIAQAEPPSPEVLPNAPLQRCATKALRGDFGTVPAWKLDAYRHVIERRLTAQGRAKRTTYCPSCSGLTCADGSRVRPGICAASRNIPMHAIVWLASDGLLKVCDRGGWVDLRHVRRGETANFDVWVPKCAGGCWTGPGTKRHVPWAVISR